MEAYVNMEKSKVICVLDRNNTPGDVTLILAFTEDEQSLRVTERGFEPPHGFSAVQLDDDQSSEAFISIAHIISRAINKSVKMSSLLLPLTQELRHLRMMSVSTALDEAMNSNPDVIIDGRKNELSEFEKAFNDAVTILASRAK